MNAKAVELEIEEGDGTMVYCLACCSLSPDSFIKTGNIESRDPEWNYAGKLLLKMSFAYFQARMKCTKTT